MKSIYLFAACALGMALASCDPIETNKYRDDYNADGTAISQQELTAALSVTQLPNVDGKVEGDQYIIVKNSRPDIGGNWHFDCSGTHNTYSTDNDTIVVGKNGEYTITYIGISGNQRIESLPFTVTVTNVFDTYDNLLTGAKDKADLTASKKWKYLANSKGNYMVMGAYGAWKYYEPTADNSWWNQIGSLETLGDERMEFVYDGFGLNVYTEAGSLKRSGAYSYTHDAPDEGVQGVLTTTTAVMGSEHDDNGFPSSGAAYWILQLDNSTMVLYRNMGDGMTDWDDCGWYVYYQPE
ncbi:MAG: hypothetical protein LUD17_12510 [Bacteroidales bacterium]|nr:hypothetical protein [Bacteroidales bacterium]